jgi:rare lipoprotein A
MLKGLKKLHLLFYILTITVLLLNGCSSTGRKDGPPPYDVDVSHIPDATPKVEPLSKYGNMSSYKVFGKKYYVMRSSKYYDQEGIASWYGTKFHKQRTSSGERYDMLAMTAAHKTLPLPTYVQVTNLSNHRTVIVKVNDRGPFEGSRIIDLSYAAAKKLGMTGKGTAKVRVTAIDPARYNRQVIHTNDFFITKNSATPVVKQPAHETQLASIEPVRTKPSSYKKHFAFHTSPSVYLQVGAFRNKHYAERLKKQLSPIVSSPISITLAHTKKSSLYHVTIGPIKNAYNLAKINKQLKSIGVSSTKMVV